MRACGLQTTECVEVSLLFHCFGLNKTNLSLHYVFVNRLVIFGTCVLLLALLPLIMETLLQVNYGFVCNICNIFVLDTSVSACVRVKSSTILCN